MTDKGSVAKGVQVVEFVRLSACLAQDERPGEPNWWADVTGSQPAERTSKPSRGELQETGQLEENTLLVSLQPGRVDWFLTPRISEVPSGQLDGIRSIGPFPISLGNLHR